MKNESFYPHDRPGAAGRRYGPRERGKIRPATSAVKVLLMGRGMWPGSHLAWRLAAWGADCRFASSCKQARELLTRESCEIVLSEWRLPDGPASQLTPFMEGSLATFFISEPVDSSCWWIPVVDRGKQCLGAPAMRPAEFGELVRQLVKSAQCESICADGTPQPAKAAVA